MGWADIQENRMFRWHKEIERLDIPASQVLHLERSLSAVQVALPGLPSQEATAYLCAFAVGKGLRVTLVLHLHTSRRLAFYLHERAEAPLQEADRLIEEGALFAESMGFMLSDMDYSLLGIKERDDLWDSLSLKAGVEPPAPVAEAADFFVTEEPPVAVISPKPSKISVVEPPMSAPSLPSPSDEAILELAEEASFVPSPADEVIVELSEEAPFTPPPAEVRSDAPDALSGSGTTMRARARKLSPSAEELTARRQKLLESLGRFLASL
jgi:hypothetical protein